MKTVLKLVVLPLFASMQLIHLSVAHARSYRTLECTGTLIKNNLQTSESRTVSIQLLDSGDGSFSGDYYGLKLKDVTDRANPGQLAKIVFSDEEGSLPGELRMNKTEGNIQMTSAAATKAFNIPLDEARDEILNPATCVLKKGIPRNNEQGEIPSQQRRP